MNWLITSSIILVPFVLVTIDIAGGLRTRSHMYSFSGNINEHYKILVPIWGSIKYLENVIYLSKYGSKVILCTPGDESEEFYMDLDAVARKYSFIIFRDSPKSEVLEKRKTNSKKRTTSGSMRDTVIRNALRKVMTPYVVTLDADSTTLEDLSYLVGEFEHRKLDIASIRILPDNASASTLTKLQAFEYTNAMNLRFLYPWLISGACHVAKTETLRNIMNRHSLFFQGNDVETGLIARDLGYKVGHIPFIVLTAVPDNLKSWFRQRLAWSGGEFRLFIVNFKYVLKYPFFWFYGGILTICIFPLRWVSLSEVTLQLFAILGLYVGFVFYLHWRKRNRWLFLMPFYALFLSLVMTPLGVMWYFYMAHKDRNYGIIRSKKVAD